jgi:hypothetical protein
MTELIGMPGDLHEAVAKEIKAHVPSLDWSRARLLTECIMRVFVRHYEASEANEQQGPML